MVRSKCISAMYSYDPLAQSLNSTGASQGHLHSISLTSDLTSGESLNLLVSHLSAGGTRIMTTQLAGCNVGIVNVWDMLDIMCSPEPI